MAKSLVARQNIQYMVSNKKLAAKYTSTATVTVEPNDMAKWVLETADRTIENPYPYPVLKAQGYYPSIINPDPLKVWDTINNRWVNRTDALPYQGRIISEMGYTGHPGKLKITVSAGSNNQDATDLTIYLPITDMDTLNHDYCYGKVQLPYYNEQFGNRNGATHAEKYGNNYTDKVVTGWKILSVNNDDTGTDYTFNTDWEAGCNYASRSDKYKDLYGKSGRVFAQGGYYYVPEGVTAITIEAYWGNALYLHGKGHSLDRVSVCTYDGSTKNYGYAFTPAGTLPTNWVYNNMNIYDDLDDVVKNRLSTSSATVYDQAVVLVGNFQVQARNDINLNYTNGKKVTFMSADLDFDKLWPDRTKCFGTFISQEKNYRSKALKQADAEAAEPDSPP